MEYFYSFIYLFLVLKNIYYEKNIITCKQSKIGS